MVTNSNLNIMIIYKGMKKMVVNFLEKIFVTSDAATIMTEVFIFLNIY
jgi:hypothetical protein